MRHLTPELEAELFDHILAFGSISAALRQPAMPDRATVARWGRADPEFAKRLHAVRVMACDILVDEMLDIADEDPGTTPLGATDSGAVAWAKHRTDVRKWIAERVAQSVYGPASKVQHTGPDGGPAFTVVTGVPRPEVNIDDLV